MPRLFTALTIPEQTRMWLSTLRGGLRGARWIDPENYHITLRFIGDVNDRDTDEIHATLSRVTRAPLEIRLNGLGSFGNRKPHSIWARVEPTPELAELQGELERRIQRLGHGPDPRRFTPHVTIARLRGVTPRDVAEWLSMRGGFSAPSFGADEFVLLSSRSSVGGGPYVTEERYPLGLAAAAA
ncbi:MAG: RNA 2',3'-cyclic phosphodiesterase [Pseudomonadota bacterium]